MLVRSLSARVLTIATVWVAVALIVLALLITQLYRQGAERGFSELVRAQLFNAIASVTIGPDGQLSGLPEFGDLRFSQPRTGWYWIVEPLGDFGSRPLTSISLGTGSIPIPSIEDVPFDERYQRVYSEIDSFGNPVQVAETEVVLDSQGRAARFRVAGNRADVASDVNAFSRQVLMVFAVFGIATLAVNALAILYGLRPLDSIRRALEKIRTGENEVLEGDFPREIEPLAAEMNAVIDSNRRIVERARMQVGNLAHSLKTPIAVLVNESRSLDQEHGQTVRVQADTMQRQVQTYLDRARIAAQANLAISRTEAEPVLERLVRVMRKLNENLEFELYVRPPRAVFALEQHDLEEIVGNLLENAAKYADSKVRVAVVPSAPPKNAEEANRRYWLQLVVEDDGPGLADNQIALAMKRGKRLDESKPGTGLGLSIVSEVTREYQGSVKLGRGELGGLRAKLVLPAGGGTVVG